jgi:hypothetical protein
MVLELKLELFVQAIPEVGANEFMYGLVVAVIHFRSFRLGSSVPDFPATFDGGVTMFAAVARYLHSGVKNGS